jgi:serine/threonine protein kinase
MDGSLTGFVEGRELGQLSEGAGAEWSGRRYVIRSSQPLGTGAGSCVYEAVDRRDGSTVAVKVIDRLEIDCEPSRVTQLEREINIWNKLQHPNIINLLDVVFEDSWVLLVIESRRDRCQRSGRVCCSSRCSLQWSTATRRGSSTAT